jgi:regulatory protein
MDSARKKAITRQKPVKKAKKITADYLHNSGLYYLQRFSASSGQFHTVMLRKIKRSCHDHPEQDYEDCVTLLDRTVEKFIRAGLLNDDLYTQGAVKSLRRQGKSRRSIVMKLQHKGVAPDLVAEKLDAHDAEKPEDGDLISALIFIRRKKSGPFGNANREKTLAAMARAGFSYEISNKAMALSREDAEYLLSL